MDVVGPPGVGKSHLAGALGVAAVKAGISVYRATLAELTDALLKAEKEWRLTEKLRFYTRVSLLIVCAIGCLPVTGGREPVLPAGQRPLRERLCDPDLEPGIRRMGRHLR